MAATTTTACPVVGQSRRGRPPLDSAAWLASCSVSPDVWELRPDYRAELIVARGLQPVPSVELDELVARAEQRALTTLADTPVAEIGHIGSWREAFRAFGAKPSDYRNSAEALMRRASAGLPRINPLTDAYNAISVLHATPIGGENLQAYAGPARLVRASGMKPSTPSTPASRWWNTRNPVKWCGVTTRG